MPSGSFKKVVDSCTTTSQLLKVYQLVQKWEGFEEETVDVIEKNCALLVAFKMLAVDKEGKDLMKLTSKIESGMLPKESSVNLVSHCEKMGQTLLMLKLVLQLKLENKYEEVLEILTDNPSCDNECLELLVSRGLVSRLVSTPLYHQLVNMVVEEEESIGKQVVDQLVQGGHKPQAMSLRMVLDGVPAGLRTMASVLQMLRSGNNNK